MPMELLKIALVTFVALCYITIVHGDECRVCFAYCTNIDQCHTDCKQSIKSCRGPYCYTRLDLVESGYYALQGGCTNQIPHGGPKCYMSGERDYNTQYCYCEGRQCNQNVNLEPPPDVGKTVSCCKWRRDIYSDIDPTTTWTGTCPATCSDGTHCFTDFVEQSKGCGYGKPRFYQDLQRDTFDSSETMCVRYRGGYEYRNHLCSCSGDRCNEDIRIPAYSRDNTISCLSAQRTSRRGPIDKMFTEGCYGGFCFISYTTAELTQDFDFDSEIYGPPQIEERTYELTAGCVYTNHPELIRLGCRADWSNSSEPISVHCICDQMNCNNLDLVRSELQYLEPYLPQMPAERSARFVETDPPSYSPSFAAPSAAALALLSYIARSVMGYGHD